MKCTQEESEAIVRLLLAGRCQDGVVSLSEGDEFKRQVALLPWSSEDTLEFFIVTEAARIRKTMASGRAEFIAGTCARLRSDDARAAVLAMLPRVLAADGMDARESAFVSSVRKALER